MKKDVQQDRTEGRQEEYDPQALVAIDPGKIDNHEVYDEADLAQHQQLIELANIFKQIKQRSLEGREGFDGQHCVDCGEEIPAKRLAVAKCIRCVDCQELWEEQERRQKAR